MRRAWSALVVLLLAACGSSGTTPGATRHCEGQEGPPKVQVCWQGPVRAGAPATFQLEASGRVRDDCGSPYPEWGDGTQVAVCTIGCLALPEEDRTIHRTFTHTYAKPGTYGAVFHLSGCGSETADQATVRVVVDIS